MNRYTASVKHFLISLIIFTIVTAVLIYFWYPTPYFMAAGGWQGLKIAAPIDLVLGPLLTLIVVNKDKEKSKLVFDLIVIAFVQVSALGWGISTIYQQRPVANVYWGWEKSFFTVTALDLKKQGYDLSYLSEFGAVKPVLIVAAEPKTKTQINSIRDKVTKEFIPPYLQTNLYESLEHNFEEVKGGQLDLVKFLKSETEAEKIVNKLVKRFGGSRKDYVIIPLFAKYQDLGIVFEQNGEYKTTIFLRDK